MLARVTRRTHAHRRPLLLNCARLYVRLVSRRDGKQDITDIYVRTGVDVFDGAPHDPWKPAANEVRLAAVRIFFAKTCLQRWACRSRTRRAVLDGFGESEASYI